MTRAQKRLLFRLANGERVTERLIKLTRGGMPVVSYAVGHILAMNGREAMESPYWRLRFNFVRRLISAGWIVWNRKYPRRHRPGFVITLGGRKALKDAITRR